MSNCICDSGFGMNLSCPIHSAPLPRIPDETLQALLHEGMEEVLHTESHVAARELATWLAARGVVIRGGGAEYAESNSPEIQIHHVIIPTGSGPIQGTYTGADSGLLQLTEAELMDAVFEIVGGDGHDGLKKGAPSIHWIRSLVVRLHGWLSHHGACRFGRGE